MGSMRHVLALLVWAGAGLVTTGCAYKPPEIRYPESGATLTGTVTYGKEKVGAALVIAQNASGSATGFLDDDGRFELQNVPLGTVSLGVDTVAGKGQAMGKFMAQSQGKAKGAPRIVDVPAKYAKPGTSGLSTEVHKGANAFDIVIPK